MGNERSCPKPPQFSYLDAFGSASAVDETETSISNCKPMQGISSEERGLRSARTRAGKWAIAYFAAMVATSTNFVTGALSLPLLICLAVCILRYMQASVQLCVPHRYRRSASVVVIILVVPLVLLIYYFDFRILIGNRFVRPF